MVGSGRRACLARNVGCRCHDGYAFHGRTCLASLYCADRVCSAQPLALRVVDESPLPVHNLAMGQGRWRAFAVWLGVEAHPGAVR